MDIYLILAFGFAFASVILIYVFNDLYSPIINISATTIEVKPIIQSPQIDINFALSAITQGMYIEKINMIHFYNAIIKSIQYSQNEKLIKTLYIEIDAINKYNHEKTDENCKEWRKVHDELIEEIKKFYY